MSVQVNYGLLRLARQRKGFPQGDAAARLGVPQVTLSRYENGVSSPNTEFVKRAAAVYDLPRSFFEQPDVAFGAPVSVHPMWRKKHDVTARELDYVIAELNLRAIHIRRLLQSIDHTPKRDIPKLELEDFDDDIERVASIVRSHWLLPAGPVANLTACLELAGCLVIHSDLGGSAISGVTVSAPGLPSMVLLNAQQPADRMRFTLAHELGHMVLHRFPSADMEREANAFASALLMPADEMKIVLSGRIDLRRLASLKPEWRVSMQGLLYRAQALNLIGKSEAGWLWRQFNAMRIKLREPPELDFSIEEPSVLTKMVNVHLNTFGYSEDELAALFHIHQHTLKEMYPIKKISHVQAGAAKLRIIQ